VIVHEAPLSYGPGAEVAARIMEKSFYYLEAPIARVTGYDIVIPLFARENHYIPSVERIVRESRKVMGLKKTSREDGSDGQGIQVA
jgi:pyruvate dehydrogenase E1 component beta subunit